MLEKFLDKEGKEVDEEYLTQIYKANIKTDFEALGLGAAYVEGEAKGKLIANALAIIETIKAERFKAREESENKEIKEAGKADEVFVDKDLAKEDIEANLERIYLQLKHAIPTHVAILSSKAKILEARLKDL